MILNTLKISLIISGVWICSSAIAIDGFDFPSKPTNNADNTFSSSAANNPFDLKPLTNRDFRQSDLAQVELGKNLFFDKVLSGNKNISCGTCHHVLTSTGDSLSLSVGEGGQGLGHPARNTGSNGDEIIQRVPHNSPDLFNRGLLEIDVLFNDGRIFPDPTFASGFNSPAGHQMPAGLDSILAAQNILPLTNVTEMAGQVDQYGVPENEVAEAAANEVFSGSDGVWEILIERLRGIPEYVAMFQGAFDDVNGAADINITHVGNSIAAYIGTSFRADNSQFDRFLRGDLQAMSHTAQEGMKLFYNGNPRNRNSQTCGSCHSGTLQTDQDFHAIAMPQIGPGKGDGHNGREDFGHFRVSGDHKDLYKFRTPSLRNVVLTAPYGHVGAYSTLRGVVEHHVNAIDSLYNYDTSQVQMPSRPDLDAIDFEVMENNYLVEKIANASEIIKLNYSKEDIDKIMEFLYALTDPASLDIRDLAPKSVPSGLPIAD